MRPVGITLAALLAAAPAVFAQGPPAAPIPPYPTTPVPLPTPGTGLPPAPGLPVATTPGLPVGAIPGAPGAAPAALANVDPKLLAHLNAWEQVMGSMSNFRADFDLTRTEATFGKKTELFGQVLCMKPNLARLRLDDKLNKAAFEAFICNGKAVYHYVGSDKQVVVYPIPQNGAAGGGDNLMLDFLSGMKANVALARFDISLYKEDKYYVYLMIKPKLPRDKQEFEEVRFAVYGPELPPTDKHKLYLPAMVWLKKPNGDTEMWTFKSPQTNLVGVAAKDFEFVQPPKDWNVKQAPAPGAPQPGPGAPNVRPTGR